MENNITVQEAAKKWALSERRVIELCQKGRIAGVAKQEGRWVIPADAVKPADKRIRTGVYVKEKIQPVLPLPIGISDYRLATTKYYYIDKTMLIKDFLDEIPQVSLFTRPRRFGKTLNMDMLRTFLKRRMRIPPYILRIKKFGPVVKNTENIRESIL